MSHRVKITHFSTFRLNLSATPPHNADFDGDEMNMHIPQGEQTRAEQSQIAWVPRQIISPQANNPVMGIVQDTLCGIRELTLRDTILDWNFVQNILRWVPGWDEQVPTPTILKPKPLWTGKQILSMCIPSGINVMRSPDKGMNTKRVHHNPVADDGICIKHGQIVFGVVEKKTVGASQACLIHIVFREKGPEICRDLLSALQMVVNLWLLQNGLSIGIGDTIADKVTMSNITNLIETEKNNVLKLIQQAEYDGLQAEPGMTIRESFESQVNRELNMACDKTGNDAQDSLKNDNDVKQMVVAGSKGSSLNISQMSGCVGQHSVEGKRIPFGRLLRRVWCLRQKLVPPRVDSQVSFFHAMAGREALIDTAVKTAKTGYIQRRLVKAMEDIAGCYDGTVQNSLGDIAQFAYGEDATDGAFIERQSVEPYRLSHRAFDRKCRIDVLEAGSGDLQYKLDREFAQLTEDRRSLREFIFRNPDPNQPHCLPVNLRRITENNQQIFHVNKREPGDLEPSYIMDKISALTSRLVVVRGSDPISIEAQANATMLFNMHLRSTVATRPVLEELHLNRQAFDWIIGEIEIKFNASVVNPGGVCGTPAAQPIGEPATQMTLNTVHHAGVSSENVTLGVPRLKDIISLDRAKVLDKKLDMSHIADHVEQAFYPDMKAISSDDNSEKLILRCRPIVLSDKEDETLDHSEEDIFIRQIEHNMLDSVTLRGIKDIRRVFAVQHEKPTIDAAGELQPRAINERVPETDRVNLKNVLTVDPVDFSRTPSNKCREAFEVLGIEAARRTSSPACQRLGQP
ncbi:DNA-directed RNA polymerase II subunit rpb1 [Ceratobasidium sp. 395]|nr:DNA-directed RNA polymerase II subunit rpb1 [Ceratobasidium sp. 395]